MAWYTCNHCGLANQINTCSEACMVKCPIPYMRGQDMRAFPSSLSLSCMCAQPSKYPRVPMITSVSRWNCCPNRSYQDPSYSNSRGTNSFSLIAHWLSGVTKTHITYQTVTMDHQLIRSFSDEFRQTYPGEILSRGLSTAVAIERQRERDLTALKDQWNILLSEGRQLAAEFVCLRSEARQVC